MKHLILLAFCILDSIFLYSQELSYWSGQNEIKLQTKNTEFFVCVKNTDNIKGLFKSTEIRKSGDYSLKELVLNKRNLSYNNYVWAVVPQRIFNEIAQTPDLLYFSSNYSSNIIGDNLQFSNLFYVKLKQMSDTTILYDLARHYGVNVVGNNRYMPLWHTLLSTTLNTVELYNIFDETNLFASVELDLINAIKPLCTSDPLFDDQWNLSNTGQYSNEEGFDIDYCHAMLRSMGSQSTIVAVIDEGVELNHQDIPNICNYSYNSSTNSSPSGINGPHGTSCAGIIGAASNNNIGVAGIAPACPIMSISYDFNNGIDVENRIANCFNYAVQHNASVISNSWGGSASLYNNVINDAIMNAIRNGRNGLGCIVVFSAGNEDSDSISYPANLNDSILCVGAMSPCGERKNPNSCDGENWWGSNYGPQLDVVAPGVLIPTTDLQGTAGYTTANYTPNFNGTSAACPHVAAVAALILSRNPSLTQKEVCDIIERTARMLRPEDYEYGYYTNRPNGPWNEEVGYGLVDAYAAVRQACTGTFTYQNQSVTSNTIILNCSLYVQNVIVSNNAHLSLLADQTIEIDGPFEVPLGCQLDIKNEY